MKEIAVTASSGKHDNELIGRAMISLKVRQQYTGNGIHTRLYNILSAQTTFKCFAKKVCLLFVYLTNSKQFLNRINKSNYCGNVNNLLKIEFFYNLEMPDLGRLILGSHFF